MLCFNLFRESGNNLVPKIQETAQSSKLVVFNSNFPPEQELKLIQNGVAGVLSPNCSLPTIVRALKKIHSGEFWFKRKLIPLLIGNNKLNVNRVKTSEQKTLLTEREKEVLSLIAAGRKNLEISHKLAISESTVKTHINNIFRKLNVPDRLQAILQSIKYKIQ